MIKSRRMSWKGHLARTGKKGNVHRILVGTKIENQKEVNADGRMILKCILKKLDEKHGLDSFSSG
jgi:hypothetical protein